MSHLFARRITTSFTLLLALSGISFSEQVKAAPLDSVRAQPLSGTIVSVGDGDTIRVRTADKTLTVRLSCIDAPELSQRPYGQASANRLKQLLPVGQSVTLQVVDKDRYGRSVAKVYNGSQSVNLALVQDGQAAVYRQYLSGCPELRERLLSAEASAKARRLGFWAQANPVMPWDYRHSRSAKSSSAPQTEKPFSTQQLNRSPVSPKNASGSASRVDWSKAQQDIDSGRYSNEVNSIDSSDSTYGGSSSSSGSGGSCNIPSDTDSAGRSCGGRAASERPGGR
jgi:micrococcal nuclease